MDIVKEILSNAWTFTGTALAPYPGIWQTATASALTTTTTVLIVGILFCWVNNITTGYWSWVDRCWSTFPAIYALIYVAFNYASTTANNRIYLMGALVFLWGARLTYNFARKGGYTHLEDYRWPILRKQLKEMDPYHPFLQELFNLFFVAIFQMVIVYFICVPVFEFVQSAQATQPLNMYDGILAVLFLVALGLETYTDEVQWKFQNAKYALTPDQRAKAGGDIALGFCTSGPFAYSRHLNFFCEMSIWYILYGFTISSGASNGYLNYTIIGAFVLMLLFQGSTQMTENLSIQKYPLYTEYQKTTSRLIPFLPGPKIGSTTGSTSTSSSKSTNNNNESTSSKAAPTPSKARRNSRAN